MNKQVHFNFMTGVVLIALSLYVLGDSARMAAEIGGPFYASPGMMPSVLGALLLVTAIMLLRRSLLENGFSGNISAIKEWLQISYKSKTIQEMLLGMVILAAYTYILLPVFPFWLSTLLFMVFLLGVLNATTIVNTILISAVTVSSILLVFRVIFRVPLP